MWRIRWKQAGYTMMIGWQIRMEESGKMERIELLEEIKRMLESATEKELDIVWRFLREVVKRG